LGTWVVANPTGAIGGLDCGTHRFHRYRELADIFKTCCQSNRDGWSMHSHHLCNSARLSGWCRRAGPCQQSILATSRSPRPAPGLIAKPLWSLSRREPTWPAAMGISLPSKPSTVRRLLWTYPWPAWIHDAPASQRRPWQDETNCCLSLPSMTGDVPTGRGLVCSPPHGYPYGGDLPRGDLDVGMGTSGGTGNLDMLTVTVGRPLLGTCSPWFLPRGVGTAIVGRLHHGDRSNRYPFPFYSHFFTTHETLCSRLLHPISVYSIINCSCSNNWRTNARRSMFRPDSIAMRKRARSFYAWAVYRYELLWVWELLCHSIWGSPTITSVFIG